MKLNKNIFILGDSTSMTVGYDNQMYPYILSNKKIWANNIKIKNYSLAGNTSSDIASLFFSKLKYEINEGDLVIIYLGNCDSASSEINKGKYNAYQHIINRFKFKIKLKEKKIKLKNKLSYFAWNNNFDPDIEKTISSEVFKYNIKKVINYCKKNSIQTILIKASANENFMPGLGKGNFIFYKYLGLDEKIADKLEIDDERFINALKEHEKNNYDKALKIYQDILISNENISMSQEYPVLVANNIAVAKAQKKLFDEAEYILKLLLNEKTSRKEIIYFNLSKIYQLKNKKKLFLKYKKMSYEQDESLYRIREKYKNKLEEINQENKEIIFINMEKILSQNYFLDHCHLLPKGQRILAEEILKNIKNKTFIGKYKAIIENSMYNPELYRGNYRKFHSYFKTFADLNKDEISELFEEIFSQQEHDIKTKKLINLYHQNYLIELAIKFYAKHPIYEVLEDLKINTPKVPSDIGRFPEYFLVRTIIPYVEQIEKNKTYKSYFSHEIFRSSEELKKILPEDAKEYIDDYPNELNRKKGQDRFNRIIEKCREMLLNHLKQGSQINERKKATIFWYFRETLRFGSHSRISMMYDRITLEHLGEALMVAFLIEKKMNLKKSAIIIKMKKNLEAIVNFHQEYCSLIHKKNYEKSDIDRYDSKLKKFINLIQPKYRS